MSIQLLKREENKLFKIRKELFDLKEKVKFLDLGKSTKKYESGSCPLLKIAGFAEIGPMSSEEIDEVVYKL